MDPVTRWHNDRRLSDLGLPVTPDGHYVSRRYRCAPGLGWPLAGEPQSFIDPAYVRVMMQARNERENRGT